jgi:hypothetical protein
MAREGSTSTTSSLPDASSKESIPISPIAGGLMLVAGVALLLKRGGA